jgi:ribosome-associated toxin RatA of RatAB toxin-antitoxin module
VHTVNHIRIEAPARRIYEFAAAIERWPDILPHYRSVRLLSDEGHRRVADMAAWRDFIPVRWQAEQVLFPDEPRITFRHVGGITKGMEVEWRFSESNGGTDVSIYHEFTLNWPLIGTLAAERIIGPMFVANIAGKTLRRIRQLAEARADESARGYA